MTQTKKERVFGLVLAAGIGTRVGGDEPKQYRMIGGETVLARSVKPFLNHPRIDGVVIVISRVDAPRFKKYCSYLKNIHIVFGGNDRQDSVRIGLEFLSAYNPEYVLIHDAARPFLPLKIIDNILKKLHAEDSVIPVLRLTDTLKRIRDGKIVETLDRTAYVKAQTPQGFRYKTILNAHQHQNKFYITDDAGLLESNKSGLTVIDGSEDLFKITYETDLLRAARFIASNYEYRTGNGFDVHRFGPGNSVILCGIKLPYTASLIGHSDADVSFHAITDALLGAIAEGDIGDHFPPTDSQWKDISSEVFLKKAIELMIAKFGEIVNVDVTIICELPKINPFKLLMKQKLSEIFQTPLRNVNVKATTTEGLGAMGRQEGIASQATVTVRLPL